MYGSGAKRKIEGHAEKKDNKTLVLESIEIGSTKTKIEKQFTRLFPLTDISFSDSLFTKKEPEINVRVNYRTLDGKKYQLPQSMVRENRADGLFNVSLSGSPYIRNISSKGNISDLERRVLEKLYRGYKETGVRTKWKATDAYRELGIKDGTYVGLLNNSKPRTHDLTVGALGNFASAFYQMNPRSYERGIVVRGKFVYIVLDGTHECFMITDDGIKYMEDA